MNNVLRFPRSPSVLQAEAEELLRAEMRMQLAVACGSLTTIPTTGDLCDVLDRINRTAELVYELAAIRSACQ